MSTAQPDNRVFELRTYTAHDGKHDAMVRRFPSHVFPLFERHQIDVVGYWVPVDSPQNETTLVYLIAHPSRDAAEKTWAAFRADPEWHKTRAETEKDGPLVAKVVSVYLTATEFSALK